MAAETTITDADLVAIGGIVIILIRYGWIYLADRKAAKEKASEFGEK